MAIFMASCKNIPQAIFTTSHVTAAIFIPILRCTYNTPLKPHVSLQCPDKFDCYVLI